LVLDATALEVESAMKQAEVNAALAKALFCVCIRFSNNCNHRHQRNLDHAEVGG
jgi:hypothetical protein